VRSATRAVYPGEHEAIVDRDLWDRVQAALAENRVERAVRSDAASPSLLAGLVRDEDGIPLTPTHANKKGRRYRYYVSHDLIARTTASADEEGSRSLRRRSSARQIPANDLEGIVEDRIGAFFQDSASIDTIVAMRARDVDERRELVTRASAHADAWPRLPIPAKIGLLHRLVRGIVITADTIDITLSADAVFAVIRSPTGRLGSLEADRPICPTADEEETIALSVPATLKRVGMEMRHLVDAPEDPRARKPDRSLMRLLARARIFREAITAGDGCSIAEFAEAHGCGAPYFTRIVRRGFLAPDITAAILDGCQPIERSAKRIAITADLPMDRAEQRRMLGFG
jgi:hypothetical protein